MSRLFELASLTLVPKFSVMTVLVTIAVSFAISCIFAPGVAASGITGGGNGVPTTLPSPWTFQNCYSDTASARSLRAATFSDSTSMTVESCISFCQNKGYNYAGVEYARECFCDWTIQWTASVRPISECNMPCTGNQAEACGAGNHINIYYNGAPLPTIPAQVGGWAYDGCYTDDDPQLRTLIRQYEIPGGATNELCQKTCNIGWDLAGTEYGTECHCSGGLYPTTKVPDSECSMACKANTSEFCGGVNRVMVYRIPGSVG